jgi:putative membrane protein
MPEMPSKSEPLTLLILTFAALLWSGISPFDRFTWFLEVVPVMIGAPILIYTYRGFPLTSLLYKLLFLHALILIVGGHYTYAEVPLGHWFKDAFDLSRNHYDRLGHFAQGFVPAILAREILLRRSPLVRGKWLFFLVTCVCLAFSAFYEMIEWWTAVAGGDSADAFLGAQGDIWDSHWDMFLALNGAIISQLVLRKIHDKELKQLEDDY